MKRDRLHQGNKRQDISIEEAEAQKDAGLTPGVTPDIHAPEISHPSEEQEVNLHGDIDGSPFSRNPGEMSLADAAEKDKANADAAVSDDASTRQREAESRITGVDTETLAAEDEAEGDAPKPKPKASGSKK